MSDIAIRVENPCPEPCPEHSRRDGRRISKRYRIGLREEMHDTFAGALTDLVTRPVRNLRRLRRLTTFEDGRRTKDEGQYPIVQSLPKGGYWLPSGTD